MTGRLLIVDDVPANRIVMKARLAAAGHDPATANDAASALLQVQASVPDMMVLDLTGECGLALISALRSRPATAQMPILVLSADSSGARRTAWLHAGADEVLAKPVDEQHLLALIRSHMRRIALEVPDPGVNGLCGLAETSGLFQRQATVAIITARQETGLRLRKDLAAQSRDQILTLAPEAALTTLIRPETAPDAMVIEVDLDQPGGGLRLMSDLQSRAATCHCAFALLLAEGSVISPAMAYDLGAQDVILPGANGAEIALRVSRLIASKQAADRRRASVQDSLRLAAFDPLTGVFNRRYGDQRLLAVAEQSLRDGVGFAVLIVDLDRFKRVNDNWGHPAGDAVLVAVAALMGQHLRHGDLLARLGGEEFVAILPGTTQSDARKVAERLCHAVEAAPVTVPPGHAIPVTVSVGVAACPAPKARRAEDLAQLMIAQADRALLYAKSHGRNRVTVFRSAA
jgi:two-component system cell cycle response regulator